MGTPFWLPDGTPTGTPAPGGPSEQAPSDRASATVHARFLMSRLACNRQAGASARKRESTRKRRLRADNSGCAPLGAAWNFSRDRASVRAKEITMSHALAWAPRAVPRGSLVLFALILLGAPQGAAESPSAPAPAPAPPAHAVLGTYVRGPDRLVPGTPAALRIATHWAASESESGPLPGVEIEARLHGHARAAALYHGRSDAAGGADARFQVPVWPAGRYTLTVDARAGARHDSHTHEIELAPGGKLLLESDKPLYQPAQVIHLRALGERLQDGRPLAGEKVVFEVTDPRGNKVFHDTRALSKFGVAAADFALADEILLGTYRARAALEGGDAAAAPGELELRVERYALPKFKVTLSTDRAYYARP